MVLTVDVSAGTIAGDVDDGYGEVADAFRADSTRRHEIGPPFRHTRPHRVTEPGRIGRAPRAPSPGFPPDGAASSGGTERPTAKPTT